MAQSESVLCKVIHSCLVFDSQEATSLLQGYYECTEGNVPRIQVRLELLVLGVSSNEPNSFDFKANPVNLSIKYFYSADINMGFIVLRQEYEAMRQRVLQLKSERRFDQSVRILKTNPEQPDRVVIIGESAYETCYGNSQWLSLEVMETKEHEKRRRSANLGHGNVLGTTRVNFWQLDLEEARVQIEPAFDAETT